MGREGPVGFIYGILICCWVTDRATVLTEKAPMITGHITEYIVEAMQRVTLPLSGSWNDMKNLKKNLRVFDRHCRTRLYRLNFDLFDALVEDQGTFGNLELWIHC